MQAVKNDGQILYYASHRLRDDRDVVLAAVTQKPLIYKYASLRLRGDKEIASIAIQNTKPKQRPTIIDFLADELKEDKEFLAQFVE